MDKEKDYVFEEVNTFHETISFEEILEYYSENYQTCDAVNIIRDFEDNGIDIIEDIYGFEIDSTSDYNIEVFKQICSDFEKYLKRI